MNGEVFPVSIPQNAPPEMGTRGGLNGRIIGTLDVPLDVALDQKELNIAGNVFWIVNTSDLDVAATINVQEQINNGIPIRRGFYMSGVNFSRIFLTAAAQAGKTLTILYAHVPGIPFNIENSLDSVNEIKLLKGSTLSSSSVSVTVLGLTTIAANVDRVGCLIQVDPSATGVIYVGGVANAVTLLTDGIALNPGESIFISEAPAANIYMTATGATTAVRLMQEIR